MAHEGSLGANRQNARQLLSEHARRGLITNNKVYWIPKLYITYSLVHGHSGGCVASYRPCVLDGPWEMDRKQQQN